MADTRRKRSTLLIACAAVIGISLPATILNADVAFFKLNSRGHNDGRPHESGGRRFLRSMIEDPWLTWARDKMVAVNKNPNPDKETPLFWHIPKSGGTTIKNLYSYCMGFSLANHVGIDPRYGHNLDKDIVTFSVNKALTAVNVDVNSKPGILRAKKLGLVASEKADLIVSTNVMFAGEQLFDAKHKGRIIAVFRHPVERLVSLFYYLQVADWETTFNPKLKEMSLFDWAMGCPEVPNRLVRQLANTPQDSVVDESDVARAVHILERRVVVGLTDRMEESVRRFNFVFGLDEEKDERLHSCMEEFFGNQKESNAHEEETWKITHRSQQEKMTNTNHHPRFNDASPEWKLLAEQHKYDIMLYENILRIFDEQKQLFDPSPCLLDKKGQLIFCS